MDTAAPEVHGVKRKESEEIDKCVMDLDRAEKVVEHESDVETNYSRFLGDGLKRLEQRYRD